MPCNPETPQCGPDRRRVKKEVGPWFGCYLTLTVKKIPAKLSPNRRVRTSWGTGGGGGGKVAVQDSAQEPGNGPNLEDSPGAGGDCGFGAQLPAVSLAKHTP